MTRMSRGWRRGGFWLCDPEGSGLGGVQGLSWRFYSLQHASLIAMDRIESNQANASRFERTQILEGEHLRQPR